MNLPRSRPSILQQAPEFTVGQLRAWAKRHDITFTEICKALGVAPGTLGQIFTRCDDNEILPAKTRAMIASVVIASGLPGLFKHDVVSQHVVVMMAKGFQAMKTPKHLRSVEQCNVIGYASRMTQILLEDHKYELQPRTVDTATVKAAFVSGAVVPQIGEADEQREDSGRIQNRTENGQGIG